MWSHRGLWNRASAVNPSNLPDGLTIDGIKVGSVKKKTKDGIKTNEVKTYYNEDTDKEYTESERVKKEKSLREKLSSIVYKITDISEINNIENDNFVDMIISIKDKGYETDLVREIGEGCDKLITLYDTKSIPPKMVNTILSKYNELERNIIN